MGSKPKRIKVTGVLSPRNVAYIHHTERRGWRCTLDNGTPASMFYVGITRDEQGVRFELEDAADDAEWLSIVRSKVGPNCTVELI